MHSKINYWLAKRTNFFYGWIILPISTLAAFFTSPGQTYMVSVFNPSLREALDLSLTQLTGAYMFGTVLASLPQTYIGQWADRIGIRKTIFIIATLFSLACVFISQVSSLLMLFISFFFLRMLGQGALELLSVNMLPMWFRNTLGTVSGIKNVVVNLLIGVVPISILALIGNVGWRKTYILAGASVFLILLPIIYFFYINRPEEIGQTIDGDDSSNSPESVDLDAPEKEFNLKEAMRTRAYWILTLSWFAWAAIATAITFNLLPIFTAKGLTEEQAAASFTILMVVSAIFQIFGGMIADRVQLRWMSFGAMGFYGLAIGALIYIPDGSVVLVYTLILGMAQGLFGGLGNTVWVRYFGREHLGKIRGSVWTAAVAGSSVGPFIMGITYDLSGDFFISLAGFAVILFGLAIAGIWATPPVIKLSEHKL
ncbi:MAG: MFS transporter [Anaerolineae bacterium]|jgi:MFS family permease|nr:MFS transporter [Anaerolineae bacterium]MBT3713988.1 MFS transporter [Anaerolineae bacterium]MBT4312465.1 MFS transporter [Anaerolineae bacterium]MBT4458723.1 MFS transporter [Anaerolineae bacterium]MBT4842267.1 MFS transporter [Anaerolineae bacterium]